MKIPLFFEKFFGEIFMAKIYDSVLLRNSILYKRNLSENAIMTYIALMILRSSRTEGFLVITSRILYHALFQDDQIDKKQSKKLINGLNELSEKTIVRCQQSQYGKHYLVDIDSLNLPHNEKRYVKNSSFTALDLRHLRRIATIPNITTFKLIRYYIFVMSVMNPFLIENKKRIRIGSMCLETIAQCNGISPKTAREYNHILTQDLRLLYIAKKRTKQNDELSPMFYSLYKDRLLLDYVLEKYYRELVPLKTHVVNENRAYAMKYYLLSQGYEFDLESVDDIYRYYYARNELIHEQLLDTSLKQRERLALKKQLRDLKLFIPYGYAV